MRAYARAMACAANRGRPGLRSGPSPERGLSAVTMAGPCGFAGARSRICASIGRIFTAPALDPVFSPMSRIGV